MLSSGSQPLQPAPLVGRTLTTFQEVRQKALCAAGESSMCKGKDAGKSGKLKVEAE